MFIFRAFGGGRSIWGGCVRHIPMDADGRCMQMYCQDMANMIVQRLSDVAAKLLQNFREAELFIVAVLHAAM